MTYTVIYQEYGGDIKSSIITGSHDKKIVWSQSKKKFKRLLAIVPGRHQVVFGF